MNTGLRASIYGVPFRPINGFTEGSSLPELTGQVKKVTCPVYREGTAVVPALNADVSNHSYNMSDEQGNAYIEESDFKDLLIVKAAKRVIISTKKSSHHQLDR